MNPKNSQEAGREDSQTAREEVEKLQISGAGNKILLSLGVILE